MTRKFLVADLLCGAGGSSTGCERALNDLGLQMELVCVNHWPVAIETHRINHPRARHYVQDIATVRPHQIVPEGYLDLLMASPTCTHHSVARGGKPTSDQQRSDPWHIITWLTELRVRRIIIENVWEFIGWGPVDHRTGKPIKARKGEYFNAWIDTIRRLGFEPEWRKLNAANYGDATTRQRFILKARSDRRIVGWAPITHHQVVPGVDLHPGLQPWRPAREIIDWKLKGKSIFDRKKPLAAKTLARIEAGAVKFGWPEPFLVILRNHMAGRSIDDPIPTVAANGRHIGLAQPVIVRTNMHGRKSPGARGASDPLMTITTDGGIAVAQPFVLSRLPGAPRSTDDPIPTQTAQHSPVLIAPYYGSGSGETCKNDESPLDTVTAKARFGMVVPVKTHGSGTDRARNAGDEPLATITASKRGEFGIVVPVTNGNGGPRARSDAQPLPTMTTAKGGEFALVMPVTHEGGIERARDANSDPLPTVTGANRGELAFIAAQFGERDGQAPRVHDVAAPASTGTTLGHGALVEATAQYDILFRMLEPHELAAAMGFTNEDQAYEFAGNKTEQIKQIGNAVSVAMMKAEVTAIMSDAIPRRRSQPARQKAKAA